MSTELDRRELLRLSALGAGAISLGPNAWGPDSGLDRIGSDKILVVVQLSGGNDGLNTVIPFEDDDYHRARRTLRQKKYHKVSDGVAFPQEWTGMKQLLDQGDLAVVQGVGYPNPNRSHFKSMDIWHSADPSSRAKTSGWLGRLADLSTAQQSDPDFTVNVAAKPPLALAGKSYRPISFSNAGAFRFSGSKTQMKAYEKIASADSGDGNDILELLGRTARDARQSSDAIRKAAGSYKTTVAYGNGGLGRQLRTVAAMIDAGLSTRIYYVYHNGFDTHVNQAFRHGRLMQDLSVAVAAFQKDLARLGKADRVATLAFSEFGRRVKENGSRGTDHGTAGPAFLIGSKVKGGLLGEQPSLTDLDRGDLKFNTDFRRIYATISRRWLGVEPKRVMAGEFAELPLFG